MTWPELRPVRPGHYPRTSWSAARHRPSAREAGDAPRDARRASALLPPVIGRRHHYGCPAEGRQKPGWQIQRITALGQQLSNAPTTARRAPQNTMHQMRGICPYRTGGSAGERPGRTSTSAGETQLGAQPFRVGDRQPAGEVPANVGRRSAVHQPAAGQQRDRVRSARQPSPSAPSPRPTASTAPGGAASRAVRCSAPVRSSPGGPTIAISAGPEIIASATASPQPPARG